MREVALAFLFSVVIFIQLTGLCHSHNIPGPDTKDQEKLAEILLGCSDYCDNLSNSVLDFVCREKIEEKFRKNFFNRDLGTRLRYMMFRVTYLFDYQMKKRGSDIDEVRDLLEVNGKKRFEKNAQLKTARFYSKRAVLGPVGLLAKDWQGEYKYRIVKEGSKKGRKFVVIEAKPLQKSDENAIYGKIWVDTKDFSVFKIEVDQGSLQGFEKINEDLSKVSELSHPKILVTHFYDVRYRTKGGKIIRFPSKTVFVEMYKFYGADSDYKLATAKITYSDYKFFTVEVEVEYD